MMKRMLAMLLLMLLALLPSGGAWAEALPEPGALAAPEALAAMTAAHPGCGVLSCAQWGGTAAAVLAQGEERILCVAEKQGDEWQTVVDNPRALPAGAEVSLLMDSDMSLYWSIPGKAANVTWMYSCYRGAGQWGEVDCIRMDLGANQLIETSLYWESDTLKRITEYRDENENFLRREESAAIPAKWMRSFRSLQTYDASILPVQEDLWHYDGWLNETALRLCAAEIAPEYTFVDGAAKEDGIELLMREKDGTLRLVTCACYDGAPITNISSPLPENTHYGFENFWDAIAVNDHAAAGVSPYADGAWAVRYTWPMTGEGDILFYGRNWISCEGSRFARLYVGDHPWRDVSSTDWNTLPASLEEALTHLDPSRWAVVNNPDPADRLHLRYRDDRTSRSFGKYYNGTPAEVLRTAGDWAFVRVGGVNGWMMKKYLAFGRDAWEVQAAFPDLSFVENREYFLVWRPERNLEGKLPADGDWSVERGENFVIMGIVEDDWYHVWFPDRDESGYMRRSDFWPGNG